jgi:hypothetical protein
MDKSKQTTTYRRGPKGQTITETVGKDYDSDAALDVQDKQKKAFAAMATGAKPRVSDEEPKDKNSLAYIGWKRRQKNRTAQDGAVALASR